MREPEDLVLRDNLDDNDMPQYVVVMGDSEYARKGNRASAQFEARRLAADQLIEGGSAYVEIVLDHPGNSKHGDPLSFVDAYTTGES